MAAGPHGRARFLGIPGEEMGTVAGAKRVDVIIVGGGFAGM